MFEAVEELKAALTTRGVSVTAYGLGLPAHPVDAVIVLLGVDPLGDEELAAARRWGDRVIPVSVDGQIHEAFRDDHQILLPTVGPQAAAAQIAFIASIGGRAFVRIRQLLTKAEAWERADRDRSHLLGSADETDQARAVLASTPPEVEREQLRPFVEASAAHHRHRSRLTNIAALVVIVVLATASTVALLQRQAAANAAVSLAHQADAASSKRLSSLALSLLDTDPDLPRIAALAALQHDPGPEATAAARQVLAETLAHRSYLLPGLPRSVSAARGSVAVTYTDGSVDLRSQRDGSLSRHLPARTGALSTSLSPDGRYVALFTAGGYAVEPVAGGAKVATGAATFGIWVGDTNLVLLAPTGIVRAIVPGAGASRRVVLPRLAGSARALAASLDGTILATVVGTDVATWSTSTGALLFHATVQGARDVEFSASGALLVTSSDGWKLLPHPGKSTSGNAGDLKSIDASHLDEIRPLAGGGFVGVDSMGRFGLVGGTDEGFAHTVYGRAHRGVASGVAPLPDGKFATVGADRYLRLWARPSLTAYPANRAFQEYWSRIAATAREGWRPVMTLSPDAATLTMTQQSPSYVAMVDPTTLKRITDVARNHYLGDIVVKTEPCGDAGVVMWTSDQGQVAIINLKTGKTQELTPIPESNVTEVATGHIGCSADGSQRAWADERTLRIWDPGEARWLTKAVSGSDGPVSVLGASGPIAIATRGGDRVTLTAHGQIIRARLTPETIAASAATVTSQGRYYAVGADGQLYASSASNAPVPVEQLTADLGAFALRASPDGRFVAAIGDTECEIIDTATGKVAVKVDAGYSRKAVRDLAFTPGALIVLDATGGLTRHPFPDDADLTAALALAPRAPSTDETALGLAGAR